MRAREFTTAQLAGVMDVTERELQHWNQSGLIIPRKELHVGRYSQRHALTVGLVKFLLDVNLSMQEIRPILPAFLEALANTDTPIPRFAVVKLGIGCSLKLAGVNFVESGNAAFSEVLALSLAGSMAAVCDLHAIWEKLFREGDARH